MSAPAGGLAFSVAGARPVLERTPATVRAMLLGLPAPWLDVDEGPETFSPREVIGHLTHGEETDWIARARRILEHGEERPFDPFERFAHRRLYAGLGIEALLDRFAALRRANLAALDGLAIDEARLARRGRHPDLGPVTLAELLATWVVHDLGHIAQIARVMARAYGGAVGPWQAYLPILTRR